jgi:hypothetical protein
MVVSTSFKGASAPCGVALELSMVSAFFKVIICTLVPASSSQLQARERASEGASAIGVFQGMGLHRPAIAKKNAELV